jgi:hypothetical protein
MTDNEFYDQVYARDSNVEGKPNGWIQWKGTSICIDLHCICGEMSHMDVDFFYHFECACGRKYAVGQNVTLIELTPDELAYAETHGSVFMKEDEEVTP